MNPDISLGHRIFFFSSNYDVQGLIAQSQTGLTADPGVARLIPARSHIFVEIDCEIIFRVILLLPLIQKVLLSVTSESKCTKYWLTT